MKEYLMEGEISKVDPIKRDGLIIGYRVGIDMGNGAIGFVVTDDPRREVKSGTVVTVLIKVGT